MVYEKHSSKGYLEFLKLLDAKYPKGGKIRLILGKLKMHTSEETRKHLEIVPERFEFVFTPKQSSCINLVKGFFNKMVRQMLKR